jgi:hypothetical protein
MQDNQRVPGLPNSFDAAGLYSEMWACMGPEAQGRFIALPPDKQNEVVNKWLEQREQQLNANDTQARTLQMPDQEYNLNINSDVFATVIKEPGFGRLEEDLEEQEGMDTYPAPFTDSGYKSAPNLENCPNVKSGREKSPNPINTDSSPPAGDGDNNDAKTSYSIGTTVNPRHASSYIVELCKDIYNKLHRSIDAEDMSLLSKGLPELIKAFAIKLCHEDPTWVNRRIMHFIHKRHQ